MPSYLFLSDYLPFSVVKNRSCNATLIDLDLRTMSRERQCCRSQDNEGEWDMHQSSRKHPFTQLSLSQLNWNELYLSILYLTHPLSLSLPCFIFFLFHSYIYAVQNTELSLSLPVLYAPSFLHTGVPRYMREIGTKKISSHITNSHIKRPRMTVN